MIANKNLLEWLKKIDNKLNRKIIIIAVGGTALTLMNLKESTKDIDLCVEKSDYELLRKAIPKDKFRADIFQDGYIFCLQLPEDYIKLSKDYEKKIFKNILLKLLNPLDIIITKAARYNARDEEDIALIINKISINKDKLIKRFKEASLTFAGSDNNFSYNFKIMLKRYFKE